MFDEFVCMRTAYRKVQVKEVEEVELCDISNMRIILISNNSTFAQSFDGFFPQHHLKNVHMGCADLSYGWEIVLNSVYCTLISNTFPTAVINIFYLKFLRAETFV